jgi:hypothetical protein
MKYLSFPWLVEKIAADEYNDLAEALETPAEVFSRLENYFAKGAEDVFNGATFHPLAGTEIVTVDHLRDVRAKVIEVAVSCGFPGDRTPDSRGFTFEQKLAQMLPTILRMSPAEASSQGTWAFMTIRILPDIALWRWPIAGNAYEKKGNRWSDPRRQLFQQAYKRGYLLGDSVFSLTEDDMGSIIERPRISGHRVLAASLASHQARLRTGRATFRSIMKAAGRQLAHRAIYSDEMVTEFVEELFESHRLRPQGDGFQETDLDESNAREAFLESCWEYRHYLEEIFDQFELGTPPSVQGLESTIDSALSQKNIQSSYFERCRVICDQIRASASTFDKAHLLLASVAIQYLVLEADAIPDELDNGLMDDLTVLEAAAEILFGG